MSTETKHVILCVEGRDEGYGMIIEPGAVRWDESEHPIVIVENYNFDDPNQILGRATNIQREGDNITADIPADLVGHVNVDGKDVPLYEFNIYCNEIKREFDIDANTHRVISCRLRAVGRVTHRDFRGANPGAHL